MRALARSYVCVAAAIVASAVAVPVDIADFAGVAFVVAVGVAVVFAVAVVVAVIVAVSCRKR